MESVQEHQAEKPKSDETNGDTPPVLEDESPWCGQWNDPTAKILDVCEEYLAENPGSGFFCRDIMHLFRAGKDMCALAKYRQEHELYEASKNFTEHLILLSHEARRIYELGGMPEIAKEVPNLHGEKMP